MKRNGGLTLIFPLVSLLNYLVYVETLRIRGNLKERKEQE